MNKGKSKSKGLQKGKIKELPASRFPIVGIGASAGGLDAIEQFLAHVPENSGMGYVVIQHLDPTQKGMLPELLQRETKMAVILVADNMVVKQNCVYVIPPNTSMSILNGALHLFEPLESRGLRLPIDFFFRSLADDLKEMAIGVILSGMGSDGSIGIKAIKEKNGIVLVQDPSTAKFNSMPRNAIDSVLVDIVAPALELPLKLVTFFKNIPVIKSNLELEAKDTSALEKIIILLRINTGNDFSLYKKNTLYRRIERRMGIHKIDKIASYVHYLQENSKEVDILFKELLIGVTNFFRDPEMWENLKSTVIPSIIAKQHEGSVMRAWVPGCSTGEEAYSLAIVFKEAIGNFKPHMDLSLQIFATDLDSDAIEIARKGVFPSNIVADVSKEYLNRFFIATDEGYRVSTEIREMVVFAQHNIIMHPPFTKIDILSCRNLLIYMDSELQKKLLSLFFYSLNFNGVMILGSAETLGAHNHLFVNVESKLKIFKRSVTAIIPELFDFPSSFSRSKPEHIESSLPAKTNLNIQTLADQLLLQHFSPVGVLVNENGDIIYIIGRTGKFLEPPVGKANLNIFAMLRDGLRNEIPVAFRKAVLKKEALTLHNLKVGTNGNTQSLDVTIKWIDNPEPLHGMVIIIFTELPETVSIVRQDKKSGKTLKNTRQAQLENELQLMREEKQKNTEEMQTSQEELKSTNEELQSTNEELQSANEELTTSKEEMQSLNEELQTVNAELQSKVDDFSRVNNDMKNLLNSTDIATLFLDKELNIRRFTNQATKIFKLIKSDVGRPFTDQVSDLIYPELVNDALEVLNSLVFIQKQIPTKDGRWFLIRIMPYRTFDDRIDGLVITFINHSDQKQLETELHETRQMNRFLLKSSADVIIKLSADLKIQDFNPDAETFFGIKYKDAINKKFVQMFIPEKQRQKSEIDINKRLGAIDNKFKLQMKVAGGIVKDISCTANVLFNEHEAPAGMILMIKKNDIIKITKP